MSLKRRVVTADELSNQVSNQVYNQVSHKASYGASYEGSIEPYFQLPLASLLGIIGAVKIQYIPLQIQSANFTAVLLADTGNYL